MFQILTQKLFSSEIDICSTSQLGYIGILKFKIDVVDIRYERYVVTKLGQI